MPLARYEIRNEYSLANPDLYRSAAKDDPEGLLEGVAMAGLVGIIRQLGDLAEFAAEVFHDLHEEVLATAARGHELLIRVQQLEAELPVVEKLILTESSQFNFAYAPGVEWHASIRDDQNQLTQGDLPRFIRNAYEDCRGPPRLFLLDKFDVAGAGACLKRYTDPSFFKMEWASSELLKAEKEQQDKRARRIKKKGRQHQNVELKEASHLSQMSPRMQQYTSVGVENLASTSSVKHANANIEVESKNASFGPALDKSLENEPLQAPLSKLVPQDEVYDQNAMDAYLRDGNLTFSENSYKPLKENSKEMGPEDRSGQFLKENHVNVVVQKENVELCAKIGEDVGDDVASETEHYMDALTTMDSEVETDSETKPKHETDNEFNSELKATQMTVDSEVETDSDTKTKLETDNEFNSELKATKISGQFNYPSDAELNMLDKQVHDAEDDIDADDDIIFTHTAAENFSGLKTTQVSERFNYPPDEEFSKLDMQALDTEDDIIFIHPSAENLEPLEEKLEPVHSIASSPKVEILSAEEDESPPVGHNISPSIQEVYVPTSLNESSISNFPTKYDTLSRSDDYLDSGSIDNVSETPQSSELNDHDNTQMENLGAAFQLLPEPAIPLTNGDRPGFSDSLAPLFPYKQVQSSDLLSKETTQLRSEWDGSEAFKSESVEGPKEILQQSPAEPMSQRKRWTVDFSQLHIATVDTDEDIDDMQMSSTLSSPKQVESSGLLNGGATRSMLEGNDSELSKSESNDSPRELFPHSPDSALQPIRWTSNYSQPHIDSLDTDDDMDGMQISSASPSSSSSMLSSPRPSMLATTVFHVGSEDEPNSVLSTQDSSPSSRKSPIGDTTHAPVAPHSPVSLPRTSPDFLPTSTLYNENFQSTYFDANTSTQRSSFFVAEPEQSPPLPPLPPLEWWMMKHFHNSPSSTSKCMESPTPAPPVATVEPVKFSEVFKPSMVLSKDEWRDSPTSTIPYSVLQGSSPLIPPEVETEVFPDRGRSSNITSERTDNNEHNMSLSPPAARANESFLDSSNVILASENGRKNTLMTPQRPGKAIQDSQVVMAPKFERKDSLIKAIASHDRNTMRKVSEQADSARPAPSDDREVLLEQIRTRSFSLRHTLVEKHEAPRPVTNINVAAILEKANAIRQAFAGSDEDEDDDDDWSDM